MKKSIIQDDYKTLVSKADLVYLRPAEHGREGHPIGNGRMGTMVWTTPSAINFQINRSDVFAVNKNHGGSRSGDIDVFGGCAKITVDVGGTPFQALEIPHQAEVTPLQADRIPFQTEDNPFPTGGLFRQRLALYEAEDIIEGEHISARCFISAVSDILVLEVDDRRAEPKPLCVTVSMWRAPEVRTGNHTARYKFLNQEDSIVVLQQFSEGHYYCASALSVKLTGGMARVENTSDTARSIIIDAGQGRKLILISSTASWDQKTDVVKEAQQVLINAYARGYESLGINHKKWWSDLWSRTFINTKSADGVAAFMQRIRYLQLYYMASSSRGSLPAKWNGSLFLTEGDKTGWGAQFWVWTTQISCYPLYSADAAELTDPFFNMYVNQLPAAKQAARQRWGASGAYFLEAGPFDGPVVLPDDIAKEYQDVYLGRKTIHDLSPEALKLGQYECVLTQFADGHSFRGKAGRFSYCSHIAISGSNIAQDAWRRYRYTGDMQWLETHAYPLLKETVEFYRHLAKKEDDGKYHLYGLNQFEGSWGTDDGLMDLTAIRSTIPLAIRAAEELDTDEDFRSKWSEFMENLAPYPMGSDPESHGVVSSDLWAIGHIGPIEHPRMADWSDEGYLFGIFPLEIWTLETKDPEIERIVRTLSQLNLWHIELLKGETYKFAGSAIRTPIIDARLGMGEELPKILNNYYSAYKPLSNGFSLFEGASDPSIEYLGCISMTLNEALIQSISAKPGEAEVIRVFPAWPVEWDTSFRLLVRGGFIVSSSICKGVIEFIELQSRLGEPCRLRNPWSKPCLIEEAGHKLRRMEGEILEFDTKPDEYYLILPEES